MTQHSGFSLTGSLDMRGQLLLSVRTVGAAITTSNLTTNELAIFVGGTSGATLALRSGGTIYYWGSTSSAAG